ncbi:MAG: SGNH/GDSL hydrolase family protein [Myxococcales bacterium]|nr:SGNH/GDSL hydrolase family protein [Myxococcales bacterium]
MRTRYIALLATVAALALAACGEVPSRGGDALPLTDTTVFPDGARPVPDAFVGEGGGGLDGGPGDGAPPSEGGVAMHPARYVTGRTQSPLSPYVVRELKKIVQQGTQREARAFAKIGASATKSTSFMHCFAGSNVDLDGRNGLQLTIQHFSAPLPGGTTSFDRTSLCATVGWNAAKAIAGSPTPLAQEVAAISPRFAVVMYGTNDIGYKDIFGYANNMLELSDRLMADGVIPILTSIMPRDDNASADVDVPRYNAVVRGVAQALQIPFIDFHRELLPLPGHGLAGDNLHPSTYSGGACVLTAAGLQDGYNVRNLITIEALDRMRRVVLGADPAPDAAGPALAGDGSPSFPFVIDHFPFSDMRNTAGSPYKNLQSYSGCNATQDESGGEYLYKLVLTKQTTIHAYVFDRGSVDIDLHLLDATASEAGCIARDHQEITRTLQAGTYHLALDTFVMGGSAKAGEYLLVVLEE